MLAAYTKQWGDSQPTPLGFAEYLQQPWTVSQHLSPSLCIIGREKQVQRHNMMATADVVITIIAMGRVGLLHFVYNKCGTLQLMVSAPE